MANLGPKQTPYGIMYLIKWNDGLEPTSYPVSEAHRMFGKLVIKFLESNIEFVRHISGGERQAVPVVSQQRVQDGNPIEIVCKWATLKKLSSLFFQFQNKNVLFL